MTSMHAGMLAHKKGQQYKQTSSPLHRHDRDLHNGEVQLYTARILGRERSVFPLSILEGLYIENQKPGTSMNEKNEMGRGGLVCLMATRAMHREAGHLRAASTIVKKLASKACN